MIYKEIFSPRLDDYAPDGRLALEAMLKLFECVGGRHAESVQDKVADGDRAWVLVDWLVAVTRRPALMEKLELSTWVRRAVMSTTVCREYLATDLDGNELFRADCKLAMLDLRQGKMVRLSDELLAVYTPEPRALFDAQPPRLREAEVWDAETPILLRRSDADYNGHIHNTKYLDFALEALPEEAYDQDAVKSLRVVYRSPLRPGDAATLRRTRTDAGWQFSIRDGDRLCALLELGYAALP